MIAQLITKDMIHMPSRNPLSSKGQNGKVLIIAGSPEYPGAAALASIAALRSGADSVLLATPEKVAWMINCASKDVMTYKLPGTHLNASHYELIARYMATSDCVLVGPGVSENGESKALMRKGLENAAYFKVLDAGALCAFEPNKLRNAILLPNPGEYARLEQFCDVKELVNNGNVVVRKLSRTLIYSQQKLLENTNGNAGLTKSGTGDVLAGLTAGFLAQSGKLLQSAINSTHCLGLLGDSLYERSGGCFYLASDLAEEISQLGVLLKAYLQSS